MKTRIKKLSLFLLVLAFFVNVSAQKYPTTSYELSENGMVLMKWLGEESVVDMNEDEVLQKVQKIYRQAFEKNTTLKSLIIGENVTELGSASFNLCSSLESVVLSPKIEILPSRCFRLTKLKKIKMSDSVKEIGNYAFWGCDDLKIIAFGKSLESIGAAAFRSIPVEFLNLPASLKSIDNGAFSGLRGLQMLTIYATNPPVLLKHTDGNLKTENEVFQYINFRKVKLLVPKGSAMLYKDADQWNQFKIIEEL